MIDEVSSDVVDPYADLARKRRESVEKEAQAPKPSFVTGVEHSEVVYNFHPAALPFVDVDPTVLSEQLKADYDLTLGRTDFSPLLKSIAREQLLQMDEAEILRRLVRSRDTILQFEGGRFPLRNDFVPIRSVDVSWESILVRVGGVSRVAEVVAGEVIETMWRLAGAQKRWQDIQEHIQMIGYGTTTRVQLPFLAEKLMNPLLTRAFKDSLSTGSEYVREMGRVRRGNDGVETIAVSTLDELHVEVSKFDPATGTNSQNLVRFSVIAKSDHGTGRLSISSHLPYELHIRWLSELFDALSDDKGDDA